MVETVQTATHARCGEVEQAVGEYPAGDGGSEGGGKAHVVAVVCR
ncbi:hypothetical protein ABZW47_31595 [Streptomyces sp. NPDC004549]